MDYPLSKAVELRLDAGKFKDRAGAVKGSVIPAGDWANAITDEVLAVIVSGGLVATEGQNDQLRDAILAMIAENSGAPRGHIDGLISSNSAGDPANDIDFGAGVARDDGDAANLKLAAVLTKRLDAAWAVGTNAGGLDTGAKAADSWYYPWLIGRSDTGVVDGLFSLSDTAPTMPANYDQKRRIGAVRTDGVGDILAFIQRGDQFRWKAPTHDVNLATNPSAQHVSYPLSVPATSGVEAIIAISGHMTSGAMVCWFHSPDVPDSAAASYGTPGADVGFDTSLQNSFIGEFPVLTDGARNIRVSFSAAPVNFDQFHIFARGWIDSRGRDL